MNNPGRALVLGGKTGLLGQALTTVLTDENWTVFAPGREDLNLFDPEEIASFVDKNEISHIFNTVAYTKVDQAEDERNLAYELNKKLPTLLGNIAREKDIYLIHYSTDFVFDGQKNTPYTTKDKTNPLSVYGQSKLEGEKSLLDNPWNKLIIIRTAWLFGPGRSNFVAKILDLAKNREALNVVHDQVGSPTYTLDLAKYSLELIKSAGHGLYHLTNSGQASWCELASEAIKCAGLHCRVNPITSSEYPQKAVRPPYSVLDCSKFTEITGIKPRSWIQALRDYIFRDS
jgi:dTDP-4-dehydrorhamnose reductase